MWICPAEDGHLQATGRDARGRKQSRYHPRWRVVRDETKFHRMKAFARALPGIRRAVRRDLALKGMPREKALATVVRLLETTLVRIGNDDYSKKNHSSGLTTIILLAANWLWQPRPEAVPYIGHRLLRQPNRLAHVTFLIANHNALTFQKCERIDTNDALNLVEMLVGGDDVGKLVVLHNGRVHHIPRLHPFWCILGKESNGRFHLLNRHWHHVWYQLH